MYHSFHSGGGLPVILVNAGPSVNPNGYATVMDPKGILEKLYCFPLHRRTQGTFSYLLCTILSPLHTD